MPRPPLEGGFFLRPCVKFPRERSPAATLSTNRVFFMPLSFRAGEQGVRGGDKLLGGRAVFGESSDARG